MLDDLADFLKPREERLQFGKVMLVVRELDGSADNSALADAEDKQWKLVIRCVFREDNNEPAFTDADIAALKKKSPTFTAPLIVAVQRVNGLNLESETKNSEAAQG